MVLHYHHLSYLNCGAVVCIFLALLPLYSQPAHPVDDAGEGTQFCMKLGCQSDSIVSQSIAMFPCVVIFRSGRHRPPLLHVTHYIDTRPCFLQLLLLHSSVLKKVHLPQIQHYHDFNMTWRTQNFHQHQQRLCSCTVP